MSSPGSSLPLNSAPPGGAAGTAALDLPDGVQLETGTDNGVEKTAILLAAPRTKLHHVWSVAIGLLVTVVAIAAAGYEAIAVTAGIACASVLAIHLLSRSKGGCQIDISAHEVAIDAIDSGPAEDRRIAIAFEQIERISVEPTGPDLHPALVVQTATGSFRAGGGATEAALHWVKSRLTAEIARRTWKSVETSHIVGARAKAPTITNPVMLKPDLAVKLIKIFLVETPGRISELRQAVVENDFTAAQRHAHWLKTASANVGAKHMSELCLLTEQFARDREMSHGRILCDEIARKFEKMKDWLEDLRITAVNRMAQIRSDAFMQTAASPAVADEAGATATRDWPEERNTQAPTYRARVLVVDDSSVSREIAYEFLGCLVTDVSVAENGEKALEIWRQGNCDAVFMDCELDGMSGYDITRAIRHEEAASNRKRTPIIALTGNGEAEDIARCREAGMDDYLAKPYTLETLEDVLGVWLGNRRHTGVSEPTELLEALHRIGIDGNADQEKPLGVAA